MFLAGLYDFLRASELAGRGPAYLQMELTHAFSIKHGVEGGHFVDVHFIDLCDFSYFPHGGEGEEVIVLFLSEGK
jgi:hypothetical protein